MSISVYLFSRIVSATTVSTLRGALFLPVATGFSPSLPFFFVLLLLVPPLAPLAPLVPCAHHPPPSPFLFLSVTRGFSIFLPLPSRFCTALRPIPISPFPLLLVLFPFAAASRHSYPIFLFSASPFCLSPLQAFSLSRFLCLLFSRTGSDLWMLKAPTTQARSEMWMLLGVASEC